MFCIDVGILFSNFRHDIEFCSRCLNFLEDSLNIHMITHIYTYFIFNSLYTSELASLQSIHLLTNNMDHFYMMVCSPLFYYFI